MLHVAMAGAFAASLEQPLRRHLAIPCEIVVADEVGILPLLGDVDVLVSMALTNEMGHRAIRLKLVQVPGAGLDRIDRASLPRGAVLANVYGHEIGIAEYVLGAMLALTRDFAELDGALRRGDWRSQLGGRASDPTGMAGAGGKDIGHPWLRPDWSRGCPARPRL